jgi:membrane dipeptidase
MTTDLHATARRLYDETLVWDDHSGFGPDPSVDLKKLSIWKDAGIDYLSIDVGYDRMDWRDTIKSLAAFRRWIKASDGYELVSTVDQIEPARKSGKMAVTFDIEGMNALDGSVDMVEFYYDLGVRQMLFAYNKNNLAGGGCHSEDIGLTEFGRAVIAEMNRVGMVVDCSHSSYRTTMEAMELSKAPVIFSHSNSRVVRDHERNIWDDQAKACAATGGVIGIVTLDLFLTDGKATEETLADHIDHYVNLVGPAHVGLGLDYAWPDEKKADGDNELRETITRNRDFWPERQYPDRAVTFLPPSCLPRLTEILLERQYAEDDVRGILGGNFMRVAQQVWK